MFINLWVFVIYSRCDECVISRMEDSLRHSRRRINAYRALASPSLIALSSKDPILTAFELSWELRRLSLLEHEFKCEYQVRNWSSLLFVNIIICEQYSFAHWIFAYEMSDVKTFSFTHATFYKINVKWHILFIKTYFSCSVKCLRFFNSKL